MPPPYIPADGVRRDAMAASHAAETGPPHDYTGVKCNIRGCFAFSPHRYLHAVAWTKPATIIETGFLTQADDHRSPPEQPEVATQRITQGVRHGSQSSSPGAGVGGQGSSLSRRGYRAERSGADAGVRRLGHGHAAMSSNRRGARQVRLAPEHHHDADGDEDRECSAEEQEGLDDGFRWTRLFRE